MAHFPQPFTGLSKDEEENLIGRILRPATSGLWFHGVLRSERRLIYHIFFVGELVHLSDKHMGEELLLKACLHFVHQVHRLRMQVVGVVYQFDSTRVSVHYISEERIDFRALMTDLTKVCGVRVWMRNINQCFPFTPVPSAAMALATGTKYNSAMRK